MPADPDRVFKQCTREVHQEKADLLRAARVRSVRRHIMSDAWYGQKACDAQRLILIKKASRYYR